MGYQFKNQCYDTVEQLHSAVAADCSLINSTGSHSVLCVPAETYISVTVDTIPASSPVTQILTPTQINCDVAPGLSQTFELAWLVALPWVAAWSIKMLIRSMRGRS